MNKYFVDTNIFLRLLLEDVPHQSKLAQKYFEKAKQKKIKLFVAAITIFEIAFALQKEYKFNKEYVCEKLKGLITTDYLEVEDRKELLQALRIYKDKNVSLVDAFIFSKSQYKDAQVFTLDKKLSKLTFS